MKRLCRLCGKWFETNYNWQHSTCGCEYADEAVDDELSDPQVKARIEEGVKRAIERGEP